MVCDGLGVGFGVDGGEDSVGLGLGAGADEDDLPGVGDGAGALLDVLCVLDGVLLLLVPLLGVVLVPDAGADWLAVWLPVA